MEVLVLMQVSLPSSTCLCLVGAFVKNVFTLCLLFLVIPQIVSYEECHDLVMIYLIQEPVIPGSFLSEEEQLALCP